MNAFKTDPAPIQPGTAILCSAAAVSCFHLAYSPAPAVLIPLLALAYFICLFQLARLRTPRQAFYTGLAIGFAGAAPQLAFFWNIFAFAAIPLWMVLAFWIGLFLLLAQQSLLRLGARSALFLLPLLWIGLEFFRSELYYLRFSWANWGYVLGGTPGVPIESAGMYGVSFLAALCAAATLLLRWRIALAVIATVAVVAALLNVTTRDIATRGTVRIAGIQLEFPLESSIPASLDSVLRAAPNADLIVLSEYALSGTPSEALREWCRKNRKHLIVGGKENAPGVDFYNTAFVLDPDGQIVFKQVKSVPIQFFKDGLPAPQQTLWNSPWGRIGIAICYDLSYSRVIDRLVRNGAQLLVIPTMDVADWGERQHELHSWVGPVRAREHRLPIFRLASSGISQAIDCDGRVLQSAPFPGENAILSAQLELPAQGSIPFDRGLALLGAGCAAATSMLLAYRSLAARRTARKGFTTCAALARPGD